MSYPPRPGRFEDEPTDLDDEGEVLDWEDEDEDDFEDEDEDDFEDDDEEE